MHSVLITGITGFIGSHIAENLVQNGIEVIGLKRNNSDTWRCFGFHDKIQWVDIDDDGKYKDQLVKASFDTIVHCAWIGVESKDRDNWAEQAKNINFLIDLLEVAKKVRLKKFIFLGSQAEYGNISGKVSEEYKTIALNAYGSIKLSCLEIVKTFCDTNDINWIWLRLFSLFGEKENANWLIPSLVKSMLNENQMDLTPGEQRYSYLYIKDFTYIINMILEMSVNSGIYNVSADNTITIRSLIESVRAYINPEFKLNFGALSYRENQSMHMEGDISKLCSQLGKIEFTDFNVALQNTLNYYIKN
ncbi:NAD-dependent epimerase/dehydratase family protein [Pedobacter cryoconitis]|uniref:Nucleoside-diphosphate-sugar epimerase n=1 Tax=Pedobacter cryoconitis TaxID=188932 RepID=A0A7X0MLZ3_9SPHI|nr:NAD(P)-dependent oxidoreductase [Pedobacter cryoconitis]MBB6502400.1 nucleoside-diphosphate-sugar epimerase [Pedobacter cryoconitis]